MQYLRRPARLGWDCEETQRDEANQNKSPTPAAFDSFSWSFDPFGLPDLTKGTRKGSLIA